MQIRIRDIIWLTALVCIGLAWWIDHTRQQKEADELRADLSAADRVVQMCEDELRLANSEADKLYDEVGRMQGVVKLALKDKRTWFELRVRANEIVAIRPAIKTTDELTLEIVAEIEAATGLKAQRLRHYLTPIPSLRPRGN